MIIRALIVLPMVFMAVNAQDVDAIEAARQAKAAAEKAAADAADATEAAIEQAASKAAKEARENAKRKKEEDAARKVAEEAAAEEAELDAAAAAAGAEAKRKMAAELGVEVDTTAEEEEATVAEDEETAEEGEEFVVKESSGFNLGFTSSIGFVNGELISNTPAGGSLVINTPYGFNLGGLGMNISLVLGSYNGEAIVDGNIESLGALLYGIGVNATLFQFLFSESHVGIVGAGPGVRNFSGVSLERIMKGGLNLPVKILVGGEGFITTKAFDDPPGDVKTYWGGLGVRLDYSF